MPDAGKCWEYLCKREDDEIVRMTRNLPEWMRPAHRLLLDVLFQYARTIDASTPQDDSSG